MTINASAFNSYVLLYCKRTDHLEIIKHVGAQAKGCSDFMGLTFCTMSDPIMGPFSSPYSPIIGVHSSGVGQAQILISTVF